MLSLGQGGKKDGDGSTLVSWEYPNEIKHKRDSFSLGSPIMPKEETYPRTTYSLHAINQLLGSAEYGLQGYPGRQSAVPASLSLHWGSGVLIFIHPRSRELCSKNMLGFIWQAKTLWLNLKEAVFVNLICLVLVKAQGR